MNARHAIVTGGSGFIGSNLVTRLLADGWAVSAVVRYDSPLKNPRLAPHWHRLRVVEADVRNRGALDALRDVAADVCFHLAAYNHVGHSFTQVEECFDVNARGTANVIDQCAAARRILYMSTSEVYGEQAAVPFVETMAPQPKSPYAITKYAGELYARMCQRLDPGRVVIVRAFNTYGPGQSTGAVISELIRDFLRGQPVLITKGEQTREFNYVDDIVDGLIRAATHSAPLEGPVNIAGGQEVKIKDLAALIGRLTGAGDQLRIGALPYRPNEIWRMYADATRARTVLGWQPSVSLEEGLRRTVEWLRGWMAESGARRE